MIGGKGICYPTTIATWSLAQKDRCYTDRLWSMHVHKTTVIETSFDQSWLLKHNWHTMQTCAGKKQCTEMANHQKPYEICKMQCRYRLNTSTDLLKIHCWILCVSYLKPFYFFGNPYSPDHQLDLRGQGWTWKIMEISKMDPALNLRQFALKCVLTENWALNCVKFQIPNG